MENNFICSWLFYYSQSNVKSQKLDLLIEVESNYELKKQLCSPLLYIECGKNLNFKFKSNELDFTTVFYYLTHHRGRLMDKLKDDEQQSYINSLTNCDQFSMKHHVSVIKCYMKAYVCELAPLMRVRRAFVAMGLSNNIDLDDDTFRSIQKHLPVWLRAAAGKGLQKLAQKSNKLFTESDLTQFISVSTLSSQLVYCMFFYAQTKMIQFTIMVPDINVILQKEPPSKDLLSNHVTVVIKAFSEICDNQDIFPIEIDKFSSLPLDSVQAILTIALVFHWIFGNSLKTLENLLKMSSSCSSLQNTSSKPQIRPTSIFVSNNNPKSIESKPNNSFYMAARSPGSESLSQIFSSKKAARETNLLDKINKENKLSSDGDTSPEIFLTPTEDVPMTFSNPATPTTKLLVQKPILTSSSKNLLVKDEKLSQMSISLKSEFQKKQQMKLHHPKSKVTVMSANETTWLAQKNKNETTQIPLTPKRTNRSIESPTKSDSKNLSKAQLNEIQIQMGLQRQKIQKNLKITAEKTGKHIEDSKQKAFFQAINNKSSLHRRNSLESDDLNKQNHVRYSDNRLSLIFSDETKNREAKFLSEIDVSGKDFSPHNNFELADKNPKNGHSKFTSLIELPPEKEDIEENIKEMELPQSLQESDVAMSPAQIIPEPNVEILFQKTRDYQTLPAHHSNLNNISEASVVEETPVSRKNSSASISSLSSASNKSPDKILLNQEEYYKSINILNQSLTTLQEEIRFLSQQQSSWNKQILPIAPGVPNKPISLETNANTNQPSKENSSVPETPTNNIISLTEITENAKLLEDCSPSISDPFDYDKNSPMIPSNHLIQHSSSHQEKTHLNVSPDQNLQESQSLSKLNDFGDISTNFVKANTLERTHVYREKEIGIDSMECNNSMPDEIDNIPIVRSFTSSSTDEDVSSSDSMISNVQPITFVIGTNQEVEEAQQKKAEILARREEKRRLKIELLKQKRDEERENRLSATIDELMEREEKKRLEKEKRDSLLQKYLDRKKGETTRVGFSDSNSLEKRSSSTANTPVKLGVHSKTPRLVAASGKQDSVGNLPLASSHKSTWFSSMRITKTKTSLSTSRLNDDMAIRDNNKFGVPLPPQEYTGPKLFGKRKVKTNRSVIVNAISHCCLAGSVNETLKESVLKELAEAEGTHFMILFRDARCQYRATYSFNLATDDLILVCGSGPRRISHEMVEKFYKYNSGAKQFNLIISTKHLSPAVDAICIQATYWNSRTGSQLLQTSLSITNIDQSKPKRNTKTTVKNIN